MASHALTLYTASSSTYDLKGVPLSIDLVPKSSFVREEARIITEASLAIMAPPSYAMRGGSSPKTMARSKAPQGGAKRKAPDISGPSKRSVVTPSGNTVSHASSSFHTIRPSLSYTVVGVRKPDGGYGKVLMRKSAKKPVSKMAPSGKESESLGAPRRIQRFRKLPPIKRPIGQYESSDEEDTPSKGPSITSLSSENASLWDLL